MARSDRRRRPPVRRSHGTPDPFHDPELRADVRRAAASGELAFLDEVRVAANSLLSRKPVRIADWVTRNLKVPVGIGKRHGPMRLSAMQAAVCDLFQDKRNRRVTCVKGPRVGMSFAISAAMQYLGVHEVDPSMFYDRSMAASRTFYDEKFISIAQASDTMRDLLPEEKFSGDRQRWHDRRLTNGAAFRFRSVSNKIKSDNGRWIFCDEAGDVAYRAGGLHSEGSKIALVVARAQEFSESMVFVGGTPTSLGECTVSEEHGKSNQCEWVMPFPCCGTEAWFVRDVRMVLKDRLQVPHGAGLRYTVDERGACDEVWYECGACAARVPGTEKVGMLERGRWVPTRIGEPGHVGVSMWMAHSQDPNGRWEDIADAHHAALADPAKMQAFTNMHLAKVWVPPESVTILPHELAARAEDFGAYDCPAWVRYLFAGIDAQEGQSDRPDRPMRMEMVVVGVGENLRRCVVARFVISHQEVVDVTTGEVVQAPVRPFSHMAAERVWAILDRHFTTADGRRLQVIRTCCDVGWSMEDATRWCNLPGSLDRGIVPVRGASESAGRLPAVAPGPEKGFVYDSTGVRVHKLGTQSIKDDIFLTLQIPTPAPQSWSFSKALDDGFWPGFLAEHLVETKSGRKVWRTRDKKRETGEPLDCVVYAYAAELMERKWTRFGEEMEREIAISREAIEASVEAAAERVVATRLPAELTSKPAPLPAQPGPQAAERVTEPVERASPFEIIREVEAPPPEAFARPRTAPSSGFLVIGQDA